MNILHIATDGSVISDNGRKQHVAGLVAFYQGPKSNTTYGIQLPVYAPTSTDPHNDQHSFIPEITALSSAYHLGSLLSLKHKVDDVVIHTDSKDAITFLQALEDRQYHPDNIDTNDLREALKQTPGGKYVVPENPDRDFTRFIEPGNLYYSPSANLAVKYLAYHIMGREHLKQKGQDVRTPRVNHVKAHTCDNDYTFTKAPLDAQMNYIADNFVTEMNSDDEDLTYATINNNLDHRSRVVWDKLEFYQTIQAKVKNIRNGSPYPQITGMVQRNEFDV